VPWSRSRGSGGDHDSLVGIAIGPAVLGALWPTAYDALYGGGTDQKRMVEGLSRFGFR
jgi:hypothetical protein